MKIIFFKLSDVMKINILYFEAVGGHENCPPLYEAVGGHPLLQAV
jgi:hypothetical protein